ncbi:MAG TPA: thioredoxin family protein [Burkholderiaceae bacterium]|jgi:thioredoxin-related protein|nr:thioredoxin family protein [Burkholderiaceae bacterium]
MKLRTFALSALLLTSPAFTFAATEKPAAHAEAGIDWYKGDVDAAFSYAKKHNKPLFLYWGAVWCPPCNQVKATVFNRQGFIERSRFFVPVHLDGDDPSAQKLGARFKVRGYPTMILFHPDGTEITRLPGEVDSERYLQVLELGMNAGHSVKDTLRVALADGSKLTADDWRLLAYYSWDTDEQQMMSAKELPTTLQRLAALCPPGDTATHLALSALVAAATAAPVDVPSVDKTAATQLLLKVLRDPRVSRDNMDILTNYSSEIVTLVSEPKSDARAQLAKAWDGAMERLADDTTLSKADRLSAIDTEVALARLDIPEGPLAPALVQEVRQRVAAADHATTDIYERQSVINNAQQTLSDAGLIDESDVLLKAELKRSHSPYYFMKDLAANAKKRGDTKAALDWYEQAYNAAKGPATRLQWGSAYLGGLLELAPDDEKRIEKAANSIIGELGDTQNAFYERNRRELEKLGHKFQVWNTLGQHDAVFKKVHQHLSGVCSKLPANDPQRATCEGVLETAKS